MTQPAVLTPRPRAAVDSWQTGFAAFALAAVLALIAIRFGWRGSDLPAQVFRAELVRRDGIVLWNSQWFGGHATLAYSVLSPILAAITGPVVLGAVSGVAAAVLFERCARFAFGRVSLVGAMWFAVGTVTNLIVGRVTFGLGVAFGLAAVYALQRKHPVAATICAVLCSLSSPLAGAFLAIALAAYACTKRDGRLVPLIALAGALAPIALLALSFPTPGNQPYELWALCWDLSFCAILAVAARGRAVLQLGAAFYALAATLSYLIPSALGGNVSRCGQYLIGPLLACALLPRRRVLLVLLAAPLLVWQWVPTFDGIVWARTDPSTHTAYYAPMLRFIQAQRGPIGRVEIPSTYRHWEAAYAAPDLSLPRGWERQLDIAYNPIFYADELDPRAYRQWLADNGVAYVALPDTQLDDSSLLERDLLLRGAPWLRPVWHDAHWRVWKVAGFDGLVVGDATLARVTPDRLTLQVSKPGDVIIRVRASGHWAVHHGACVGRTEDGWVQLRNLPAGRIVVKQALRGTPCKT
jgi:hypothetical protein